MAAPTGECAATAFPGWMALADPQGPWRGIHSSTPFIMPPRGETAHSFLQKGALLFLRPPTAPPADPSSPAATPRCPAAGSPLTDRIKPALFSQRGIWTDRTRALGHDRYAHPLGSPWSSRTRSA